METMEFKFVVHDLAHIGSFTITSRVSKGPDCYAIFYDLVSDFFDIDLADEDIDDIIKHPSIDDILDDSEFQNIDSLYGMTLRDILPRDYRVDGVRYDPINAAYVIQWGT